MPAKKTSKPKNRFPLLLIAIIILAAVVTSAILLMNQPDTAKALSMEVGVKEAAELRDSGAFILDVRQPEEWQEYHIPGSTLIPLGELPDRLAEVPKDQTVVVVCRSGNRSQSGRDILLGAGFTQVTSMSGGVSTWRSQGLPTVSGQ